MYWLVTKNLRNLLNISNATKLFSQDEEMGSSPDNTPSKQSTMKKQSDSLDRKVKLILSKDLGDPDELRQDEKSSDDENGLNTVKEEDLSSAEDGTLLKVNPLASLFLPLILIKILFQEMPYHKFCCNFL